VKIATLPDYPAMPVKLGFAGLALCLLTSPLQGQASLYVPLDDARLPMIEHLIARGVLRDPQPFVRPFRRADLLEMITRAESTATGATARRLAELREAYAEPEEKTWWRLTPRAGGEMYSDARRDLLHPAGPDGIEPYVELSGSLAFGPVILATRPVIQPRLLDDPDWPGRKDLEISGRQADAYISAQFEFGRLFYGQQDRNWGPVGLPGIPLSNYSYGRPELGFEIGTGRIRFMTLASNLGDETNLQGETVHRYFFAHRLSARLSDRIHLALWETVVLAGEDRNFDARFRNPLSLSLLENAYGLGGETNSILGADLQWKISRAATFQGQFALDDLTYEDRGSPTRNPDRFAFTLMGFGPLGSELGWRAWYTFASSLAFRTFDDQFQDFIDQDVGIGRNFADNDQIGAEVSVPVTNSLLLTPGMTFLRQGEGRITDPYPPSGSAQLGSTPQHLIGVVEKTLRLGLRAEGWRGPLRFQLEAGVAHVANEGHVAGADDEVFTSRVMVTYGFDWQGRLR
ncbi:MAG: hypothetical protein ACREL6_07555, partial [Gemmatimonadales bacterium]